jgi:hypothetical protein
MLSRCPHCEKPIVVAEAGIHTCPQCHARIWLYPPGSDKEDRVLISPETLAAQKTQNKAPESGPPVNPDLVELHQMPNGTAIPPWEQRPVRGFMDALVSTWRLATFNPTLFFARMKTDAPIRGVAFYGWLVMTIGYMFWSLYRLMFLPAMIEATSKATGAREGMPSEADLHLLVIIVFLASPLIALVSIWLHALVYHLVLMLLDVKWSAFSATFRVVVYTTSPLIFLSFPFFGEFVAFIWTMVASVIGLAQVHRLATSRAMLAVLLPPLGFYLLILLASKLMDALAITPYILP